MRVLMTGATAGIGRSAAMELMANGAKLVVGARRPAAADLADADVRELELASLASVRAFATAVTSAGPYDAILLNAGLQSVHPRTSADGFELTFAVNHLAHYVLARLLHGDLVPGGRLILTASGTHDPAERTGLPPPRHADAMLLAFPERDPQRDADRGVAGRRAYATSKLCNVMTARALARRVAHVGVYAFDPGATPGTGLVRDYPPLIDFLFRNVMSRVNVLGDRQSTPKNSGGLLARAAQGRAPAPFPPSGAYLAVRGPMLIATPPSALARDDAACERLWRDSAALVDLDP